MAYQQYVSSLISQVPAYHQPDYVERHVLSVVQFNRALMPAIDTFTSNAGVASKLVVLRGTIPIDYRGGQYHIPVDIWLPDTYPATAPIVFVTPTHEMRVKPSHGSVDQSGHAVIAFIRLWNASSSTLVELASQLSVEFSKDPPVYRYNPKQAHPAVIAQGQQFVRYGDSAAAKSGAQSLLIQADRLIRENLAVFVTAHTDYVNGLTAHQFEQKNGAEAIANTVQRLQLQRDALRQYLSESTAKIDAAERWCQSHAPAEQPSPGALIEAVEQRVIPADTWSKQVFDEVANDFAIEDALYVLDKSLQEDRIDLNAYLKKVRSLARDQFFARAICIKIESKQHALLETAAAMSNPAPAPL